VLSKLPLFERTSRTVEVPVYKPARFTVYTRFGDWFPRTLIGLLLVALVWDMVRRRERRPSARHHRIP
jgi:apolipoprotein N-acyltransferase